MSKSELIDSILAYVPATRRLDDRARQNLELLSEGELSSLKTDVADAAAHARKLLREDVSKKGVKAALKKGTVEIRAAREMLSEANRRVAARRSSKQVAEVVPQVRAVVRKGWEAPFAATDEQAIAHPGVTRISERLIESTAVRLGGLLIECLSEIERAVGNSELIRGRFGEFLRSSVDTHFFRSFLRARTTSMLLESWDLLLERRMKNVDAESLVVEAQFHEVMRQVRNEIVHRPSVYDPHLLAEGEDVVIETRAIDGLALLGSRLIDYRPDFVVSLDRGGEVVGQLLDAEFGNDLAFHHAYAVRVDGRRFSGLESQKSTPTKIVIIDDIARSGAAMADAVGFVRTSFPKAEVRAMVIVGTGEAQSRLGEQTLYMPNKALNIAVRVPWKSGEDTAFRMMHDAYVLGRAHDEFTVSKDIFGRMVRRYQAKLNR